VLFLKRKAVIKSAAVSPVGRPNNMVLDRYGDRVRTANTIDSTVKNNRKTPFLF
jgi:hypothetical protein